ncbi:HPP family protein [Haladaptatus sp. CMSO5]|uniref:HPP family protein n=1 Tax=Haladaptatus sp. CMSO5 TaxID=3120514 RepID=UPI002FCDF414
MGRTVQTSLYAGVLFSVLAALAWASGNPFIFPSLGPSAFMLAADDDTLSPRRVVGGHLVGALSGLVSYMLLAGGVTITATFAPASLAGGQLVASAILSIVLTSIGMFETDTVHAPACATTLIVSLGVLSSPEEAALMVVSVAVLVATHLVFTRSVGWVDARTTSQT